MSIGFDVVVLKTGEGSLFDEYSYYCPRCNKRLIIRGKYGIKAETELNYCDNCGCHLNWGEMFEPEWENRKTRLPLLKRRNDT